MPEKSLAIIPFPTGGLDRRGAYQSQSPQTTPDALNVRPDSTIEGRERGGSRPGLVPAFHQTLGGGNPLRLLKEVSIVDEDAFDYWVDNFRGTSMTDAWSATGWTASGPLPQVIEGRAISYEISSAVRDSLSIDKTEDYVVEMFIDPDYGSLTGTYYIFLRMNDSSPDPNVTGVLVSLTLDSGGQYSGNIANLLATTPGTTTAFTGGTDNYSASGWLSVVVTGNSNTINVWWRDHHVITNYSSQSQTQTRVGFSMIPDSDLIGIRSFRVQYKRTTEHRSTRPFLIASANGGIYAENFMGHLESITGVGVNEIQRVTLSPTPSSGTWTLTYSGQTTSLIPYNALSSGASDSVQESLRDLSNIDDTGVDVTGSAGGPYTIEFVGAEAASGKVEMTGDEGSLNNGALVLVSTIQNGSASSSPGLASSGLVMAEQRNDKVFIADYDVSPVAKGTGAVITSNNQITASGFDWTGLGVSPTYGIRLKGAGGNEVQRIQLTNVTTGTYRLYIPPRVNANETTAIDWDASTGTLQSTLEALGGIGAGNVAVTGTAGDFYTVTFQGDLANLPVGKLTVFDAAVNGRITTTQRIGGVSGPNPPSGTPGGTNLSVPIGAVGGSTIYGFRTKVQPQGAEASYHFTVERAAKVFDPKERTLEVWIANPGKGEVPLGCRAITAYRDRMVLAGDPEAPHQWYMSRQGDPWDWDYSQEDSGRAVTGMLSLAGQLGEPVNSLMTTTNECLLFGCTNSLWILRGDAAHGGQIDNLSFVVGVVDRLAWCYGPSAQLYFLSSDGLYMVQGDCGATHPQSISRERLPDELLDLQPGLSTVLLSYDVEHRGVHIFATREESGSSNHFFFDLESQSFWPQRFVSDHQPTAMIYYQGQDSTESGILLGGKDGVVRRFSRYDSEDDGGNEIDSYVDLGPFDISNGRGDSIVQELRGVPGRGGDVVWQLRTGASAEEAYRAVPRQSGIWRGVGMNPTNRPCLRGASYLIRVSGASRRRWAFERVAATIMTAGIQQRL